MVTVHVFMMVALTSRGTSREHTLQYVTFLAWFRALYNVVQNRCLLAPRTSREAASPSCDAACFSSARNVPRAIVCGALGSPAIGLESRPPLREQRRPRPGPRKKVRFICTARPHSGLEGAGPHGHGPWANPAGSKPLGKWPWTKSVSLLNWILDRSVT